jgi:hypothetical protein
MWNALKGVVLAIANAIALAVAVAFVMPRPYGTRIATDLVGPIAVFARCSRRSRSAR